MPDTNLLLGLVKTYFSKLLFYIFAICVILINYLSHFLQVLEIYFDIDSELDTCVFGAFIVTAVESSLVCTGHG